MSRSSKKGPYVDPKLLKKVITGWDSNRKPIKTWARHSDVSPEMVWKTIEVHNWKNFVPVFVNINMVWHKLWEFAPTRRFVWHSTKKEK